MRGSIRGAIVAVVVVGMFPVASTATSAVLPTVVSLDVAEHDVPSPNFEAAIDWTVDTASPDLTLSVALRNENAGDLLTVSWPTDDQLSGTYVIPYQLLADGVYYAETAGLAGTGGSRSFELYEDAPLLDDVWFASGVDVPGAPSSPLISEDTMGGPLAGEIAVVCSSAGSGGLPVLDYTLTATSVADGTQTSLTRNGTRCSDVLSGLDPGAQYDISAVARTAAGASAPSAVLRETAMPGLPSAPQNLVATVGDQSAELSWDPADGDGLQITYYDVQYAVDGVTTSAVTQGVGGADAPTLTSLTGLTNGGEYTFRVRARSTKGWGTWSEWSAPFVPTSGEVPAAPQAGALMTTDLRVRAQWFEADAPASDPPLAYEVEVSGAGATVSSGEVSCCEWTTPDSVDPEETYDVRVRARNSAGWSDWSETSTISPPVAPDPVGTLVAVGRYLRADVTWEAPASGRPAGGYAWQVTPGREPPSPPTGTAIETSPLLVSGLTSGQDYTVTVWAIGERGVVGAPTTVLLAGTALRARASEPPTAGVAVEVRGRAWTTFDGIGVADTSVVVQRMRRDLTGYRSIDVTATTGADGRFRLSYVPRQGVAYRVALVGQPGLGGSAAGLPMA